MSMYAISEDLKAVYDLFENAVDEDNNPRELTEAEMNYLKEQFTFSMTAFEDKFDNICKFAKSLKVSAANADSERKNFKEEMDRLSKRAKAFANREEALKNLLRFALENLGASKYKTDLFSVGIQNTQMKVEALAGDSLANVPEMFLKPRELDTMAIKKALKDGDLRVGEGVDKGKVYTMDGELLPIRATQGTALVIR